MQSLIFKSTIAAVAVALVVGGAATVYAASGVHVNLTGKANPTDPNYKVAGRVEIAVGRRCSVSVDGRPIHVSSGDRLVVNIDFVNPGGAFKGIEGDKGAFDGYSFEGSVKVNGVDQGRGTLRVSCRGDVKVSGMRAALIVIGTTTLNVNGDTWHYPGELDLGDRIDVINMHDQFAVYVEHGGRFRVVCTAEGVKINGHNVPELPLAIVASGGLGAAALLEGRIRKKYSSAPGSG